jgi:hypothetical protein
MSFFALFPNDLKIALRSLWRAPALWITVALTLALGIGANAAIFTVVRAVLLKPLANRDEDKLLYIRQSAPGINVDNATFSVPEIQDLGRSLKTIKELGTFSAIDETIVGLGTPREIHAGVVDGNYFEVMGLKPVLAVFWVRAMTAPTRPAQPSSPTDSGPTLCIPTPAYWASPFASAARWAHAARPLSVCCSSPSPTPPKLKSSPISSPVHTTFRRPWSPAANTA